MNKLVCLGLLLLGSCMLVSAQVGSVRRVRLAHGDYDCSCTYYCPSWGIMVSQCFGDDDYWGWGQRPVNCCIQSRYDDFGHDGLDRDGPYYNPYVPSVNYQYKK